MKLQSYVEKDIHELLFLGDVFALVIGDIMDNLTLEAGDDAGKVKWVDISDQLQLYASHSQFIKLVAEKRDAHWSEDSDAKCGGL